jgi:hypothetical protein
VPSFSVAPHPPDGLDDDEDGADTEGDRAGQQAAGDPGQGGWV